MSSYEDPVESKKRLTNVCDLIQEVLEINKVSINDAINAMFALFLTGCHSINIPAKQLKEKIEVLLKAYEECEK